MKTRASLIVGVLLVFAFIGTAEAQQRPTQIDSTTAPTTTTHYHHDTNPALTRLRFPATAARYQLFISLMLDMARKAAGHNGVTPGDSNKAILAIRECAMNVEADGFVTQSESNYCLRVIRATYPKPNRQNLPHR